LLPAGGAAFALTLCCFIPRRRRKMPLLAMLLTAVAASVGSGCGGNSNPGSTGTSTPGTTAGTYVVTVTATGNGFSPQTLPVNVVVN